MGMLELKAQCARKEITLDRLATIIGINPASLYRKISGKSDFQRNEIKAIIDALTLTDEQVISIFFT